MIARFISTGRRFSLVAVLAALLLSLFSSPASAAPKDAYLNYNSGHCLEIGGWSKEWGAPADTWPCGDAQPNQGWNYDQNNYPNGFWLQNQNSGLCLEIPGSTGEWGARVQQWPCNGGANQKWHVGYVGSSRWIQLINNASGLCMEVAGWSKEWGARVQQWPCGNAQANQMWGI
ncbi:RICIN domain-containing protein [Kitasatospora purpeofusca]|uniref:RICIN domain-containing protein n=1 Tax=Kitasatospora purpeofusca TaxID=67352 RepID=UPI003250F148